MTNKLSSDVSPVSGERQPHTFVVRLWWEPDDGERSGEWRGSVEHVGTHTKRYFRSNAALPDLLDEMIETLEIESG